MHQIFRFCKWGEGGGGGVPTGGARSETEKGYHINEKELLAIFYTLKSFKFHLQGKHIKVFSYNTTAVATQTPISGKTVTDGASIIRGKYGKLG